MLEELLKKCYGEEKSADKSAENIKTAVLSRIEEEKPMKHFTIKPLIIAAVITATSATSLITANAASNGAVMDGIAKTFSFIFKGEEVLGTVTEYDADDGEATQIELDIPDDAVEGDMHIIVEGSGDDGFEIFDGDSVVYSTDGNNA